MSREKKVVILSSKGQLVIPKEIRKEMDFNRGDELVLETTDRGLLITPPSKAGIRKSKLRGMLRGENVDPEECEAILEVAKKKLVKDT